MAREVASLSEDFELQSKKFKELLVKWKPHLTLTEVRMMNGVVMWIGLASKSFAELKDSAKAARWNARKGRQ